MKRKLVHLGVGVFLWILISAGATAEGISLSEAVEIGGNGLTYRQNEDG